MLPPDPDADGGASTPSTAVVTPPQQGDDTSTDDGTHVDPTSTRRRWSRWVWTVGIFVAVAVLGIVASMFVRIPYYAYSPGNLHAAGELVTVEGPETFPVEGDLKLTTISVSPQRLTVWDAFWGWLDPAVSVYEEQRVNGGADRETVRQVNLQLMASSQDVATYVALERLGYDVGFTGTGAVVVAVSPGSAAEGVVERGDTIVAIDGEPVLLSSDLVGIIRSHQPGDELELTVERHEAEGQETVSVELGAREDDPAVPLMGVEVQTRDSSFVFPDDVDVTFEDRRIGGPSAGLVFTLTLLDELSPADLTGGRTIAVTGEMRLDGTVGLIGGIEQKVVTVRRAGVDTFIIPAGLPEHEMAAARRQAGDEVELIEVATLDEALEALVRLGGEPLEELDAAA